MKGRIREKIALSCSRKQLTYRFSLIAALLFAHIIATESLANDEDTNTNRISFSDGLLSVKSGKISQLDLLEQVGIEVGFQVIVVGDFRAKSRAWSFSDLPLAIALRRMLADSNAIVSYADESEQNRDRSVSAVYLLGTGTGVIQPIEMVKTDPISDVQRQFDGSLYGAGADSLPAGMPGTPDAPPEEVILPAASPEPIQTGLPVPGIQSFPEGTFPEVDNNTSPTQSLENTETKLRPDGTLPGV